MQTNLNDYDTRSSSIPSQNQLNNSRFVTSPAGEPHFALPRNLAPTQRPTAQKPKAPAKMPKERAMALANRFKRGFAIASLIGFGTFSGLVALHEVGTATTQSSQSTPSTSGSSSSSSSNSSSSTNSTNSSSSSSQSSNNFLNQQGGNTGGTNNSSSNSSSSTVTGTHSS